MTWDGLRPFVISATHPFDLLALTVPTPLLRRAREHDVAVGVRIQGDAGTGALAASFLRTFWRQIDGVGGALPGEDLAECAAALARALVLKDPASRAPRPLPDRLRSYVEAHLDDPGLGVVSVAAAHGISTRYVQKLFARNGCSLTDHIRRRRLERVHRDLLDPRLAGEPIARLAARWQFTQPSHFSRAYREAFGCTPSETRRSAGANAAPLTSGPQAHSTAVR